MTQYQYFTPCRGGIDSHEHNTYCGCEMQGVGTEVFPERMKLINENSVLDLDTNEVLIKFTCKEISTECESVGDCGFCGHDVIKTHIHYKTIQGELKLFSPYYGICNNCGGI